MDKMSKSDMKKKMAEMAEMMKYMADRMGDEGMEDEAGKRAEHAEMRETGGKARTVMDSAYRGKK